MRPFLYLSVTGLLLLAACNYKDNYAIKGKVWGYKPVYSNDAALFTIENQPARQVIKAGKIYVKDNYIFQNEIGEGIHIINNTNPVNAQRVGFIKIKGSEEIAIRGDYLYSNNFTDLVVVNISNIASVSEVTRIKNAFFSGSMQLAPPLNGGYFECVDNNKGIVVSWVKDSITNPKCRN
ncbi:MAG: hypothetical protein ABIX01_11365 [Chitinophagaceae bacterium]